MEQSAFSLLAAPIAAAAAGTGGHDPSKLISFFAQEMQLFFRHIQDAVESYSADGELPASVFRKKDVKALEKEGKRKRGTKADGTKRTRKPSAFNLFVKRKMAELKAAGVQPPPEMLSGETKQRNPFFAMAAKEWSKLSQEQKDAFTAEVAPILNGEVEEGAANGGVPQPAGAVVKAEEDEEESSEEESSSEEEEEEESSEEEPSPPPPVHAGKKKRSKH